MVTLHTKIPRTNFLSFLITPVISSVYQLITGLEELSPFRSLLFIQVPKSHHRED
jgi:hypothetical protein